MWAIGSTGDFSAYVKKGQLTSFELDWSAATSRRQNRSWPESGSRAPLARAGPRRLHQDDDEQSRIAAECRRRNESRGGGDRQPASSIRSRVRSRTRTARRKWRRRPSITDAELKGINWLVEGVQGKLPTAG